LEIAIIQVKLPWLILEKTIQRKIINEKQLLRDYKGKE